MANVQGVKGLVSADVLLRYQCGSHTSERPKPKTNAAHTRDPQDHQQREGGRRDRKHARTDATDARTNTDPQRQPQARGRSFCWAPERRRPSRKAGPRRAVREAAAGGSR